MIIYLKQVQLGCPFEYVDIIIDDNPTPTRICDATPTAYLISPTPDAYNFQMKFITHNSNPSSGFQIYIYISKFSNPSTTTTATTTRTTTTTTTTTTTFTTSTTSTTTTITAGKHCSKFETFILAYGAASAA